MSEKERGEEEKEEGLGEETGDKENKCVMRKRDMNVRWIRYFCKETAATEIDKRAQHDALTNYNIVGQTQPGKSK